MSKAVPTIKVLRKARKLVANEMTWCRGSYARTSQGFLVRSTRPEAVSFCAAGAIERSAVDLGLSPRDCDPLFEAITRLSGGIHIERINDEQGRLPALRVIDKTIRALGYQP